MRKPHFKKIGLALAAVALIAVAAGYSWPRAPYPATPVPVLNLQPEAPFSARLVPPQDGLSPIPAHITGRAAAGPPAGSLLHEWPGLHAEARFRGSAVTLRLNDTVDRWRITLNDGGWVEVARPGLKDLRIEGLPPGEHLIRAERISESRGPAEFDGFFVDSAEAALPAPDPAPLLIEFIGDSDTVGFGNTAQRRDCSDEQIFSATDTSLSYPARIARALGADYRLVARSGIGLLRNFGGSDPDSTMRQLYPLALPSDPGAASLPQPPADMLVIALGSNDFGSDIEPGEPWPDHALLSAEFGPALTDFARARLRENPGAALILLAFGEYGDNLVTPYRQAAETLRAEGARAALVILPSLQRDACLWHPSLADHALIAESLEPEIRQWLPGRGGQAGQPGGRP